MRKPGPNLPFKISALRRTMGSQPDGMEHHRANATSGASPGRDEVGPKSRCRADSWTAQSSISGHFRRGHFPPPLLSSYPV